MRIRGMLLGAGIALVVAPSAQARVPSAYEATYTWKKAECVDTGQGYLSRGSIRTNVLQVEHPGVSYYQKVTVQIDKAVGYSGTNPMWRKVTSKTYDWTRFDSAHVPTYSTSGLKTRLQPDTATLSVKATVRLKRVRKGYDTTVWSYKARSGTFQCIDNGLTGVSI